MGRNILKKFVVTAAALTLFHLSSPSVWAKHTPSKRLDKAPQADVVQAPSTGNDSKTLLLHGERVQKYSTRFYDILWQERHGELPFEYYLNHVESSKLPKWLKDKVEAERQRRDARPPVESGLEKSVSLKSAHDAFAVRLEAVHAKAIPTDSVAKNVTPAPKVPEKELTLVPTTAVIPGRLAPFQAAQPLPLIADAPAPTEPMTEPVAEGAQKLHLRPGQRFDSLLHEAGVHPVEVSALQKALNAKYDQSTQFKSEDSVTLTLVGGLVQKLVMIVQNGRKTITLTPGKPKTVKKRAGRKTVPTFTCSIEKRALHYRPRAASFVIPKGSSLFKAGQTKGIGADVLAVVAKPGFFRNVNADALPADTKVELLYAQPEATRGDPTPPSLVTLARLTTPEGKVYVAARDEATGLYYDADGKPIAPVAFNDPLASMVVTDGYGHRDHHPVTGGPADHPAIDLQASVGTPLMAMAAGRVTFVGAINGYGNCLEIECGTTPEGKSVRIFAAHLKATNVKVGQWVKAKQVIAATGNTGRTTGPHVHVELRIGGTRPNPQCLFHAAHSGTPPVVYAQAKLGSEKRAFQARLVADSATLEKTLAAQEKETQMIALAYAQSARSLLASQTPAERDWLAGAFLLDSAAGDVAQPGCSGLPQRVLNTAFTARLTGPATNL
jgi:murein DD-endopeptidase MepM/ murein hydrolase activator NlpD